MTPRKPEQSDNTFVKWALALCTAGTIAVVTFMWRTSEQLAEIRAENRLREEKVVEIKAGVYRIEGDMANIKDRLKTIEIKNEERK